MVNFYIFQRITLVCKLKGAEGIGTGWSTSIPCYNPRELVDSIEKRMLGISFTDLLPWYKVIQISIFFIN